MHSLKGLSSRAIRPRVGCFIKAPILWTQQRSLSRAEHPIRMNHPSMRDQVPAYSPNIKLVATGVEIQALTGGGAFPHLTLPYRWLRDHCHCSECVNQDTLQRTYETFKQSQTPKAVDVQKVEDSIQIKWEDGHESTYDLGWISRHARGWGHKPSSDQKIQQWGADIGKKPPTIKYAEVMQSDEGVGTWTSKIKQYGFCFVDNVPPTPEATKELLERIAFIRETHYGGFYDFTSDLTMKDTAYTSLALPAHTDTTYFSDPAGLQMFHLLSHTSGTSETTERSDLGGASLLVDGYACANELYYKHPEAFKILASTRVPWHASGNKGITIRPAINFPVIGADPSYKDPHPKRVYQIRWNNDDRATLPLNIDSRRLVSVEKWYEAAALWDKIVTSKEREYWQQLVPGRALIFDNWRVLHGRSAFTGKRRMCGGYINRDDFMSRYLNTNFDREKILEEYV